MAELEEIAASHKLVSVHKSSRDSQGTSPDDVQRRTEQKQNLRKQDLLKELQYIEHKIKQLQKKLDGRDKSGASLLSADAANRLKNYKNRHKTIRAELEGPVDNSKVPKRVASESTSTEVSTASSTSEESSSSSRSVSSSLDEATDESVSSTLPRGIPDETHDATSGQDTNAASSTSSSPNAMAAAKMLLAEMEKELQEKAGDSSSLDISSSDDEAIKAKAQDIKNLREAIKSLRDMMNQYLSSTSVPSTEEEKTARNRPMTSLVRTKTGKRPEQAENTAPRPRQQVKGDNDNDNDNVSQADLAQLHDSGQELRLPMPEEQRQRFSSKEAQKIADLEKEIDRLAADADTAFQGYARLQKAIERDLRNGDVPEKTMEAKKQRRDKYKQESLQCSVKLGALIVEWESFADLVGPDTLKSAKQRVDERKSLIERYKSEETRELEKIHADMLAELQNYAETHPGYSLAWDAVAGIVGFSVSFLIGNSISRTFPGAGWFGAAVSASLHVGLATPVVKNLMARTWSANSLAELNNYFKLVGNLWGDTRRGETELRKYESRDPNAPNKLTIDERMAENKGFPELLKNRYRDEEAGYWSYSFNYSIKAAMMAYMANWMSQDKIEVKATETVFHGIMGMVSGAEYVLFQQQARSTQPGATMSVVPTREIFAAQHDYLKSLYVDLSEAAKQDPENPDSHLDHVTMRALRKECARIGKEMLAAEHKAKFAGIARHELLEQFKGDAGWDTLSEALGRFITLIPTNVVSHFTAAWRKSPDPLLMFLGNFLPGIALMLPVPLPVPGFTGRSLVCGLIRAGIQSFVSGRSSPTVTTRVPVEVHRTPEAATRRSTASERSDETSRRVGDDSDSSSSESSNEKVSQTSIDDVIVDVSDSTSDDEEHWTGNPTERDRNAAN